MHFSMKTYVSFRTKGYRHSLIYADNVGTQKKNRGRKNCVNQGYLLVLKGKTIGWNYKQC